MAAGSSHHTGESAKRCVEILQKANSFHDNDIEKAKFLYRNRNKEYFDEVKKNGNVMEPCKKDTVGHRDSPINRKLDGIFFCVTLYKGDLPTTSPYGDTRICITLDALFKESSNLYFADFYCFVPKPNPKPNKEPNHHVLLVLTPKGSDADTFCQKNLPLLNHQENQFLRRKEGKYYTAKQKHLWVNVFYTERVNIDDLKKEFGEGKIFFKGGFDKAGKTNSSRGTNRSCKQCNLSPKELEELREKSSKEEGLQEEVETVTEEMENLQIKTPFVGQGMLNPDDK